MNFPQDPLKTYIFYANRFLYILWKKSRNKLCLKPHDTYVLLRTFFSQVNIKRFFTGRWYPLSTFFYFFKLKIDNYWQKNFWCLIFLLRKFNFSRKLKFSNSNSIFFGKSYKNNIITHNRVAANWTEWGKH